MRPAIDLLILLVILQLIREPNFDAQDNSTDDYIRVESQGTLNTNRSGAFIRWKKSLFKLRFPEKDPDRKFASPWNGQAVVIRCSLIEDKDDD